jgi:hypothetical protein
LSDAFPIDPNKPCLPYILPRIIGHAIRGSPMGRLTRSELLKAIMLRFPDHARLINHKKVDVSYVIYV